MGAWSRFEECHAQLNISYVEFKGKHGNLRFGTSTGTGSQLDALAIAGAYQGRLICEHELTGEDSVHGPSSLVHRPASARSSRAR